MYFAFKRIFQMRIATTVAVMYHKAMTGCLLIALCRVFLWVNRFVISNKRQLDTSNKRMLQYELLTVKNMNYFNK